jgi:hopene-associated glycosyltransferase HpnB
MFWSDMLWPVLSLLAALAWLAIALIGGWRVGALFVPANASMALGDVTAIVPARNEAQTLPTCLRALAAQGTGLRIIVIDDQSTDSTAALARDVASDSRPGSITVINGAALPSGWTGKLWALEQGRLQANTRYVLLLDADIALQPGVVPGLLQKMQQERLALASLMVDLPVQSLAEKLLIPAFVFFFKLLYPFHLSNNPRCKPVAAAAGGCILLEAQALERIGGFAALRGALIDDCTLAAKVKAQGLPTWIGLTHAAISLRGYADFGSLGNMIARSAFTQLHYSGALLLALSTVFVLLFVLPPLAVLALSGPAQWLALFSCCVMLGVYQPMLRHYRRLPLWAMAMPLIGLFYLAMTWLSAWRYWRGRRAEWRGRHYDNSLVSSAEINDPVMSQPRSANP